jgi:hypothetical protein
MGYAEQLLAPGESVLHRTRRHWIVLLRWVGGAALLVALGLAMAAAFALGRWTGEGAAAGAWVGCCGAWWIFLF